MGEIVIKAGEALPWERQKNEPWQAFSAFQAYRDLPDGQKTYKQTSIVCKRTVYCISKWAKEYNWEDRIAYYIKHLDKEKLDLQKVEREKMLRLQGEYGRELLEKGIDTVRRFDPNVFSPKDALQMIELGVKVERLARGDSTENIETNAGDKVNISNTTINIQKVLADPTASKLACELIEQLHDSANSIESPGVSKINSSGTSDLYKSGQMEISPPS